MMYVVFSQFASCGSVRAEPCGFGVTFRSSWHRLTGYTPSAATPACTSGTLQQSSRRSPGMMML